MRYLANALLLSLTIPYASLSLAAYPDRPIQVVVPFPAGQGADILMRVVAERLSQGLGTSVVVENRPGGGGIIGSAYAAKLPADGYHLVVGSSGPLSIAPHVNAAVKYDVLKEFTPIANLAAVTQVLVTAGDGPFKRLDDVVKRARIPPGLQYASSGPGSTSHLIMEYFAQRSGLTLSHIPYKGGPQAMVDVVAQRVPIMFDALPGILSNVRSGKLRALGVSSKERSPFLPDVPTIAESGATGFGTEGWIGLLAPAGLDPAIVTKLNAEVNRILSDPATKARLKDLAFRPLPSTPEEFAKFIRSEYELWGSVAKSAGVRPE